MQAIPTTPLQTRRSGGIMVVVLVLTAATTIAIGSVMFVLSSDMRTAQRAFARDRAFYLAESGISLSLAKLNAGLEVDVSFQQSRLYLNETNRLYAEAHDWGFESVLASSNGFYTITAVGRAEGQSSSVTSGIELNHGQRQIHALYELPLYAGNSSGSSNYVLSIGGTGTGADYVKGDVYSGGGISRSGDAYLRLPEYLFDTDNDGVRAEDEAFQEAFALQTFTGGVLQAAYNTYTNSMAPYMSKVYSNGKFDQGEAFVDNIGDGIFTLNSLDLFTAADDKNGNGKWDPGDGYVDKNLNGKYDVGETVVDLGNGKWDVGEDPVEDTAATYYGRKTSSGAMTNLRVNGKWDKAGGYWNGTTWKTSFYDINKISRSCSSWPAEGFVDAGDGVYQPAETYVDRNGKYDTGEKYLDDRNGKYDYGTQATGVITGMPAAATGQRDATGNDHAIDPPDLVHMYYNLPKTGTPNSDALPRWGYDIIVNSTTYGGTSGNNTITITDANNPAHIFLQNPPTAVITSTNPVNYSTGSVNSNTKTVYKRYYTKTTNSTGVVVNDYFLEDPTDASWNSTVSTRAIDGISATAPTLITVNPAHNNKTYYIDGNLYIHSPQVMAFAFRNPGTVVTFVVSGNITISDEFYYNATYSTAINTVDNINSGIVNNPTDELCMIALKRSGVANSGNIYLGDAQYGTGGSIHAMLYAENNFACQNLDTTGQPFLSVYGNMTAGNQILLNRSGSLRTRLDVTLDKRISEGTIMAPGLPPPIGSQRSIKLDTAWFVKPGTWRSSSQLQ